MLYYNILFSRMIDRLAILGFMGEYLSGYDQRGRIGFQLMLVNSLRLISRLAPLASGLRYGAVILILLHCVPASAEPRVLASIKPLQLIAQAVMGENERVGVLLPPGVTPHHYTMRPSDMKRVAGAQMIIWLGPESERYLAKPIASLRNSPVVIDLQQYLSRDQYGHEDPHLWLSSQQAARIARLIGGGLSRVDPQNKQQYETNLERFLERLTHFSDKSRSAFSELDIRYVVYHGAYGYFERDMGLSPIGVVSIHPEVNPGARHLMALKKLIRSQQVSCILVEPESNPSIVDILIEDDSVIVQNLDPMAAGIEVSPSGYLQFLHQMVEIFKACR